MISAIDFAALHTTSSDLEKAEKISRSGHIFFSFSLLMIRMASTQSANFARPFIAFLIFGCPSKANGMVTIPTVRISISFATWAITGLAPVPVPPPIPAVMNNIFVPSFNASFIFSRFCSANSWAFSGLPPAPSPGPN